MLKKYIYFFLSIFLILSLNEYLIFNEEIIVIISILSAVFILIISLQDLILVELDSRILQVKLQFLKYIKIVKKLIVLLKSYYSYRLNYVYLILNLYSYLNNKLYNFYLKNEKLCYKFNLSLINFQFKNIAITKLILNNYFIKIIYKLYKIKFINLLKTKKKLNKIYKFPLIINLSISNLTLEFFNYCLIYNIIKKFLNKNYEIINWYFIILYFLYIKNIKNEQLT